MPMAAKAAHTMNAAWKPARNVFWRALTPLVERFCPCDESSTPAAAAPKPVKMVPASATLNACPMTRLVESRPDAIPCSSAGAAPINARVLGAWKSP